MGGQTPQVVFDDVTSENGTPPGRTLMDALHRSWKQRWTNVRFPTTQQHRPVSVQQRNGHLRARERVRRVLFAQRAHFSDRSPSVLLGIQTQSNILQWVLLPRGSVFAKICPKLDFVNTNCKGLLEDSCFENKQVALSWTTKRLIVGRESRFSPRCVSCTFLTQKHQWFFTMD